MKQNKRVCPEAGCGELMELTTRPSHAVKTTSNGTLVPADMVKVWVCKKGHTVDKEEEQEEEPTDRGSPLSLIKQRRFRNCARSGCASERPRFTAGRPDGTCTCAPVAQLDRVPAF